MPEYATYEIEYKSCACWGGGGCGLMWDESSFPPGLEKWKIIDPVEFAAAIERINAAFAPTRANCAIIVASCIVLPIGCIVADAIQKRRWQRLKRQVQAENMTLDDKFPRVRFLLEATVVVRANARVSTAQNTAPSEYHLMLEVDRRQYGGGQVVYNQNIQIVHGDGNVVTGASPVNNLQRQAQIAMSPVQQTMTTAAASDSASAPDSGSAALIRTGSAEASDAEPPAYARQTMNV